MYTILSIRRFLLFNLLATIIATIIVTAFGNYYIDCQAINYSLDSLLVETGSLLKTLTSTPGLLTSAKLKSVQSELNANPFFSNDKKTKRILLFSTRISTHIHSYEKRLVTKSIIYFCLDIFLLIIT